jgi:hypothetical protein
MQRTDRFRGEDFAKTHNEIAIAMGYDKTWYIMHGALDAHIPKSANRT